MNKSRVLALLFALVSLTSCNNSDASAESAPAAEPVFFFQKQPYIHPGILNALTTWLSDYGDQTIAINLLDSQGSNKYFDNDVLVKEIKGNHPYITEVFTGTLVAKSLMLVRFETDYGIEVDWSMQEIKRGKDRLILKLVGSVGLGDRWVGELKVESNKIYVGKDQGRFGADADTDRILTVAIDVQ